MAWNINITDLPWIAPNPTVPQTVNMKWRQGGASTWTNLPNVTVDIDGSLLIPTVVNIMSIPDTFLTVEVSAVNNCGSAEKIILINKP